MINRIFILLISVMFFCVCQCNESKQKEGPKDTGGNHMAFKITSPAFKEGELIPKKFTCDSSDISPALNWSGAPETTRCFALICDDPDTPMGTWVHWVLYNLPSNLSGLAEAIPHSDTLPNGARQGMTDFGTPGYGGPCPPHGTHRYFFKLYALDTMLTLEGKVTKDDIEAAMKGHVLAECQLMGKYKRS